MPGVGAAKQVVSNHFNTVCELESSRPLHDMFGRFPMPVPDWFTELLKPSGKPLWASRIPFISQPPIMPSAIGFIAESQRCPFPTGSWYR